MIPQAFSEIWSRLTSRPKLQRSLSEAAEIGDERAVPYWVCRKGADPCEVDEYGYFPLLNATLNNRLAVVKELITLGANVNQKGPHGYTAMHAASQNGLRDIVECLINSGADLEIRNDDGDTSLLLATRTHHIEVIALLHKHGGNARTLGYRNQSSIDLAREEGLIDLADRMAGDYEQAITGSSVDRQPSVVGEVHDVDVVVAVGGVGIATPPAAE